MQAYGQAFARVYNMRWSNFARQAAPLILDFYAATPVGKANKSVLDLCCGTGQLSRYFLEKGYNVVGIDLSEAMLRYAGENAGQIGQAKFVQADATDFTLDERFSLIVSIFDSLNHLENEQALKKCFQRVFAVSEGLFIFDLNTKAGLRRWNSIEVDDGSEDALIITRGIYDGHSDRAWMRISGFLRTTGGLYERFDETVFNTVFDMEKVKGALLEVGWKDVYFARLQDLKTAIAEPEKEGRVFVVASR